VTNKEALAFPARAFPYSALLLFSLNSMCRGPTYFLKVLLDPLAPNLHILNNNPVFAVIYRLNNHC
jgi:hypothetical protein